MFSIINKKAGALILAAGFFALQSCNKEFEDIDPVVKPVVTTTIGSVIESDASYSILKSAVTKTGLLPLLKNPDAKFTLFAVDDAAFAASGLSQAIVDGLPTAQLAAILRYHIVPQALPASAITAVMPPVQMPTLLPLDPTNPLVKMNINLSMPLPLKKSMQFLIPRLFIKSETSGYFFVIGSPTSPARITTSVISRDALSRSCSLPISPCTTV